MTAVSPVTVETVPDVEDGQTAVPAAKSTEQKMEGTEIDDDIVPY